MTDFFFISDDIVCVFNFLTLWGVLNILFCILLDIYVNSFDSQNIIMTFMKSETLLNVYFPLKLLTDTETSGYRHYYCNDHTDYSFNGQILENTRTLISTNHNRTKCIFVYILCKIHLGTGYRRFQLNLNEIPNEAWLIIGLCRANERRRYKVTPSLTGWLQT